MLQNREMCSYMSIWPSFRAMCLIQQLETFSYLIFVKIAAYFMLERIPIEGSILALNKLNAQVLFVLLNFVILNLREHLEPTFSDSYFMDESIRR